MRLWPFGEEVQPRVELHPLENTSRYLIFVHDPSRCEGGVCPVHRRTRHHMRRFPQNFRDDRGFMERICRHGIGHPDPDDPFAPPIHGCDGCCAPPPPWGERLRKALKRVARLP